MCLLPSLERLHSVSPASPLIHESLGVLSEAQYCQNVMRIGFRLRSTLVISTFLWVAAIFRKYLRLEHESHKQFLSGKITIMTTTDANALQQICQQLHRLWSAPFRIIMAMAFLYQQLGVASLLGARCSFVILNSIKLDVVSYLYLLLQCNTFLLFSSCAEKPIADKVKGEFGSASFIGKNQGNIKTEYNTTGWFICWCHCLCSDRLWNDHARSTQSYQNIGRGL